MKGKSKPLSKRHPELHVSQNEMTQGIGALASLAAIERQRAQPDVEPARELAVPDHLEESSAREMVDRYLIASGGERMGFVVGVTEQQLIDEIAQALADARKGSA